MSKRAATPRPPRRLWLLSVGLALAAGVAIGVLASRWSARDDAAAGSPTGIAAAAFPAAEPGREVASAPSPAPGALPPEAALYPEHFEDLTGEEEPEADPLSVELPVLDKLVREPLSPVPHRVVGAWDDARDSDSPGQRRAFVVVVDPSASDQEIETLARDILARHRDSGILDVRIYDDESATKSARALDGGRLAFSHQVGEVKRNAPLGVESIRVRGRRIDP